MRHTTHFGHAIGNHGFVATKVIAYQANAPLAYKVASILARATLKNWSVFNWRQHNRSETVQKWYLLERLGVVE
jgi:hypothetical protein